MMRSNNLLALCVVHLSVWTTTAFAPTDKAFAFNFKNGQRRSPGVLSSSPFGEEGGRTNTFLDSDAIAPSLPSTVGPGAVQLSNDGGEDITSIWDTSSPVKIQGGSLRTWSFSSAAIERVQVLMKTGGRPLNANVDLWHGPDNTPQTMGIYIEDGLLRPFSAVIETPRGSNTMSIRNTGHMEFPLDAVVEGDSSGTGAGGLADVVRKLAEAPPRIVQGGAVYTVPFNPDVASVQIMLVTDGRPLNARIELLQGPNNNKQVIELYTENGDERPFFAVLECPGVGNVVRIVNTAPMEFPLLARIEPYTFEDVDVGQFPEGTDGWFVGGNAAF